MSDRSSRIFPAGTQEGRPAERCGPCNSSCTSCGVGLTVTDPPVSFPKALCILLCTTAATFVAALLIGISVNVLSVDEALTTHIQALEALFKAAAIACSLGAVRVMIKVYLHPRIWGVFSFCLYVSLTTSVIYHIYTGRHTAAMLPEAHTFSAQV